MSPDPHSDTTIPSDSNYAAHPDWNEQCASRVQAANGKRVDLIFIGDSITQNWTDPDWGGEYRGRLVWEQNYASEFAFNFGVGADKTQNVLWRLDHMSIHNLHPRVAVVLIGASNTDNTPAEIAAGSRAVLSNTQQLFPGIKIILVSILPNRRAYKLMMDTDALIRSFDDEKTVFYLDLVPLFLPKGDNWGRYWE